MRIACLRSTLFLVTTCSAFVAASVAAGCSSSATSGEASTSPSGGAGGGASSGLHGDGPCGLAEAENDEYCEAEAAKPDCSNIIGYPNDVCGVIEKEPEVPLTRATNLKEFSGTGPVQDTCFEKGHYPAKPGTSQKVKVTGVVEIFSHGCESSSVKIELYTVQRGGADDGNLGTLIGASVTTDDAATCMTTGTSVTSTDCSPRYECKFEYDNVPSETEFVVKTSGAGWAPLYDYNQYILNSEVKGGTWTHNVRALAGDDYSAIPQATEGAPIPAGNGAIAGEVHDCGDVRVAGAVVNVDKKYGAFSYFDSDEDAPFPDMNATSTSVLGLYTALDIAPGPITVAAMGIDNNAHVGMGFYRAYIFPNSVTAVTFHGVQPFQVPQ